jgi:DNA primase
MTLTPQQAYHGNSKSTRPERRGVSRRTVIEEAKAKVSVIDLADLLCGPRGLRKAGKRWEARCPLPGHEDRSPSFTVFTETNSWHCFGACQRGGDAVDLAAAAWGYGRGEMAMAAANLLHQFGHPIPERPPSWHARQVRQKPIQNGIEAACILAARRRLYRRYFEPLVLSTDNQEDRDHDAQLFWEATLPLAEELVGSRMRSGR